MKKCEKTELTVAKILEAAMAEFGRNGYAGGTVNNICKAGINKGLIYHNFTGKDQLYLACLQKSCGRFLAYVEEQDGARDLSRYMETRRTFFQTYPNEAHIFFEALLNPPDHLAEEIGAALRDFRARNEQLYRETLEGLRLREGVTMEDALAYFRLMQTMLNGYFSSPAFQSVRFSEKVKQHETAIPRLLDLMLYGIAEGEK